MYDITLTSQPIVMINPYAIHIFTSFSLFLSKEKDGHTAVQNKISDVLAHISVFILVFDTELRPPVHTILCGFLLPVSPGQDAETSCSLPHRASV